jgi:DNA primase
MTWLEDFTVFAHGNLDERVRESLWGRGVSEEQIVSFRIGYTNGLPSQIKFPDDFRNWSHQGEKLTDSYVFPLTNFLGETLGFQFRSVERDSRGYLDFFLTRSEPVLLGMAQAIPHIWETGTICIVEGVFDLFPVQRVLPFTIPTLTSKVNETLLRWLHRLVHRVILFYDSDSAGRTASRDFIIKYGSQFDIRALEYPRGVGLLGEKTIKDPADLWEAWGDEQLAKYIRTQALG